MSLASDQWQLGSDNLKGRMGYLLISGQGSNCKFLVGTKSDQETIEAHKVILSSASPVFAAMFYGEMAERQHSVPIPDIHPETFRKMLKYIYVDDITISSFDVACNIYYAAKKYMLTHLMKKCITYLEDQLRFIGRVLPTYEFALLYDEKSLIDKCLYKIMKNTKQIINDSSFEDVDLGTVVKIFSLDKNDCQELDLFDALERYVKAQEILMESIVANNANRTGSSQEKSDSTECSTTISTTKDITLCNQTANVDAENKDEESAEYDDPPAESKEKPNVRAVLEQIRFLTLTAQEFVEGPAKSDLLTKSEVLAILMNIVSTKSLVPLPSGFSTTRQKRPAL